MYNQAVFGGFHWFNCSIESTRFNDGLINFDKISLLNKVIKINEPKIQIKYEKLKILFDESEPTEIEIVQMMKLNKKTYFVLLINIQYDQLVKLLNYKKNFFLN